MEIDLDNNEDLAITQTKFSAEHVSYSSGEQLGIQGGVSGGLKWGLIETG